MVSEMTNRSSHSDVDESSDAEQENAPWCEFFDFAITEGNRMGVLDGVETPTDDVMSDCRHN